MESNTSLTDQLLSHLRGAPMDQLSQQLGATPPATESAVSAALPLLLGALGRNASQPEGAEQLFGALQRDHGGMDLGSVLGAVLGGGGRSGVGGADRPDTSPGAGGAGVGGGALDGASILGHIFGGRAPAAEAGLGQATGLGGAQAGRLLAMLAPIVLSFLAQRTRSQGMDAGGLGDELGREHRRVRQEGGLGGGLLGSLLDQNGDGQVGIEDLVKIGGSLFGNRGR